MLKNFGRAIVGLVLCSVTFLSVSVHGCLYAEVTNIGHSGSLTDYGTSTDEITVVIGVGTWLWYSYENLFYEGKQVAVPAKKIRFPCFQDEALWIQVTEDDKYEDEKAQVSLRCDALQVGTNSVEVSLLENSAALETVADAFKGTLGTSWSFFDEAVGEDTPAVYTVTLEVTEECLKKPLTNRFAAIDGTLLVMEWDELKRHQQIDEEEWDPRPTLILEDGTKKTLDSTDLAFSDFATEQAFMKEFLEHPEKYEVQPEDDEWHEEEIALEHDAIGTLLLPRWALIAIGAVVLVTVAFLLYICCASARNRRAREEADRQLALELQRAEEDGVELPDELKKRLQVAGKRRRGTLSKIFSGREDWSGDEEVMEGKGKKGKGGRSGKGRTPGLHEEEKSGDYGDEMDMRKGKKKRNAKLTRYANENDAQEVGTVPTASNFMNSPTPAEEAARPGRKAREERRAQRNKGMEDTNVTPGQETPAYADDPYQTNPGHSANKLINPAGVGDCDL